MKLVPYWRQFWKLHTVRANTAGALMTAIAASTIKAAGVAAFTAVLDLRIVLWLAFVVFLLSLIGALIDQPGLKR